MAVMHEHSRAPRRLNGEQASALAVKARAAGESFSDDQQADSRAALS